MNIRRLVAVALLGACLVGASTALAAPRADRDAAASNASSAAEDAAVAAWMRQLDRTHNRVPEGRALRPRDYVPDQNGYYHVIDDFEQAGKDLDVFKGWVLVEDLNGALYGDYYWGVSNCNHKSGIGERSAWAIGNGAQGSGLQCGAYYPHGVNSSALLRLDLSGFPEDVDALELVFDFWLNLRTEVEGGVVPDGLFVTYHLPTAVGDSPFERVVVAKLTGQLADRFWDTPWRIQLNALTDLNDPERVFNVAGLTDVDIEFIMVTKQFDGTTYPAGVYMDNLRLEASEAPGTPQIRTPSPVTPKPTTPTTPTTPSVTAETPTAETPTAETPTAETPTAETPTGETPTAETPTAETPTAETPTAETPTAETPTAETPTAETPTAETPTPIDAWQIYLPIVYGRVGPVDQPTPAEPTEVTPVDTPVEPTSEPSETPEPLSVEFDLDEVGGSGLTGSAVLTQTEDGLEVLIQLLVPSEEGSHPAQIYEGLCADEGQAMLPLEPVVDGVSRTLLDGEYLADYTDGSYSIRVHQASDDTTVVACGNIPAPVP